MRKKQSRLISVMFMLFILVSGMYFDSFRVDSGFACAPEQASASSMVPVDSVIADAKSCTVETIGSRGNLGQGQFMGRLAQQRRDTKVALSLLCLNIVSLNEGKFYTHFETIQSVSENQQELVINYIHKSDGKKHI